MVRERSRKTVFQGKKLKIFEVNLDFGQNQKATFELVNFIPQSGVSALPVTPKGIMLIKHYQAGLGRETYSLPSGGLDSGEDPEERMQLELQEELGYRANDLVLINTSYPIPGYVESSGGYLFLAKDLIPSVLPGDEPFTITKVEISKKQALEWIQKGKIVDSRVILAILLWDKFYG